MVEKVILVWHDETGETLGIFANNQAADNAIDKSNLPSYDWRTTEHEVKE